MAKLITYLDGTIKAAISLSVFLILLIVCVQVFFRFVLNDALAWPEEAATFLMIWSLFLAGAYALLDAEHARITYLVRMLPARLARLTDVALNLLVIAFLAMLMYGGWQEMTTLGSLRTGALGIPRAIPYAAIPLSSALYIAFCLRLMLGSRYAEGARS